ncbi:MAG: membrane protein insertase YidC [Bacteroidaceae bacterium]|nr:membrane protein insertase YidC [Bacteroides sp.]MBQ4588189.1 membrane protein insertase YidC [Bacteroidaceae bacterium]
MDKNTLVGFTLIGAVLIGFSIYNRPSQEEMERAQRYQDSIQAIALQEAAKLEAEAAAQSAQALTLDSTSLFFGANQGTEQFTTLENNLVKVTFSNKGGRVVSATLKDYNNQQGEPLTLFNEEESAMNFAFEGKNENILTEDLFFQPMNVTDSTVTMRLQTTGAGYIDFAYRLLPETYMVDFNVRAQGMQNFFPAALKTVNIDWFQRARQQEKGFDFEQRYTSLTYKPVDDGSDYLSEMSDDKETFEEPMQWIAFKNQFFSSVLIANQNFEDVTLESTLQKEGSGYMKDYNADMTTFFDPTGKKATELQMYLGPNHFKTLLATNDLVINQDEDPELEDLVYLGWPLVREINRWFTINLFDWLSGWGLNMGLVLLLMTIIVKAIVYPATYKSYMSSAKMRVLKPYIQKINEKYPKQEDALKKQQETMQLYSEYGVSPMGGCLPMLIQMPVFMALFFFVPNAIELRQESFLWAPDLSTYDDVINWGVNIPLLGDHLSLFCLLFSVTNILNTWYMMKQQDTGQQQMPGMKIMMYLMPVMFIFIFNSYSSGLNYYYFISGLIGILTTIILRKTTNEPKLLAILEANKAKIKQQKGNKGTQGGLMAKLEALQKEQERLQKERMDRMNKK